MAFISTAWLKNQSEPLLCPGDGLFFNHTYNLSTNGINPVTEGYVYFSLAAPYTVLPGAVSAQDFAGIQVESAFLLGFRFKYSKGDLKFYTSGKSTTFAKNVEDIGLCAVPWSRKTIRAVLLHKDDMLHSLGKELMVKREPP